MGRKRIFGVGVITVMLLLPAALFAQPERSEGTAERSREIDRSQTTTRTDDARYDDRRYEHRRPGEMYIAGFGGYTFGHSFTNIEGTGSLSGTSLGEVDHKNSAIYGGKVGYFLPDQMNWLGMEVEAFNTTPHLKQSALGPGAHLRVTTLAFNLIARGKFGCNTRRDTEATRRTASGELRSEYEHFCPIQPYAGVGLGVFFAGLDGGLTGGRSNSDNAVPGFNGLAGIRYFFNERLAFFAEYKYTRATFKFDNVASGAGLDGDYSASHVVGGLSFHF